MDGATYWEDGSDIRRAPPGDGAKTPENNGRNYRSLNWLAGFLPSTVSQGFCNDVPFIFFLNDRVRRGLSK